jgi:S1-C subfamily serine protease
VWVSLLVLSVGTLAPRCLAQAAAIKELIAQAEQGDAEAQYTLALKYDTGRDVPENYAESGKWYRKAAMQGHAGAQYFLGSRYWIRGDDSQATLTEAYKWFSLSSAQRFKGAEDARREVAKLLTTKSMAEGQSRAAAFVAKVEPATKAAQVEREAGDKARDRAVAVALARPKASGTGFMITEDGFLLTNYHVVEDGSRIVVKMQDRELPARFIKADKANDLALLKVSGSFRPLAIAPSRAVQLGEAVFTVGFPNPDVQGVDPKLTRGDVNSLAGMKDDPRHFQISVPTQPGNSGGPLVNLAGNVVGVVTMRLNSVRMLERTGALSENVNYALKSSFVGAFLDSVPELGSKLKEPSPVKGRNFDEVAKEAQEATVLVLVY